MKISLPPITQGDWQEAAPSESPGVIISVHPHGGFQEICSFDTTEVSSAELAANAKALASVPALLRATARVACDLRHGVVDPQLLATLLAETLTLAGCVIEP